LEPTGLEKISGYVELYRSGSKVSGLEVPNFVETGIGGKPKKKDFFFLGFWNHASFDLSAKKDQIWTHFVEYLTRVPDKANAQLWQPIGLLLTRYNF
jgi:hypothetical protein